MLTRLMRFEWRMLAADKTLFAVAAVLGVAIGYGAVNGARWVRFQARTIQAAQEEEKARLAAIKADIPKIDAGEKKVAPFLDPRLPQAVGRTVGLRYAVMPPGPLGALAVGQSDLYPYYFQVSTNSKSTFLNSDEIENPVHLLAGRFDLAFVILYLFPLVILAFSYNIVSAEKEAGTLGLALSQPVPLSSIVTAKIGLRALVVFSLAIGLPAMGAILGGADLSADGALPRLALWIGLTAAYGAFWFALAVLVNAFGKSSATNAMALAAVWLGFVVLIPAILNVGVKAAYPVPSRVDLIQAIRGAGDEATRQSSKLLARYLEDHPEMAPAENGGAPPDFGTLLVAVNDATERSVEPVLAKFDRQLSNQQAAVETLRFLSPAVAVQAAFNDIAGSSAHRYKHFLTQVDEYHKRWREFFYPRILRREKLSAADVDRIPAFEYRGEETSAVMERVAVAMVGLWMIVLLLAVPAFRALRRYPVAG